MATKENCGSEGSSRQSGEVFHRTITRAAAVIGRDGRRQVWAALQRPVGAVSAVNPAALVTRTAHLVALDVDGTLALDGHIPDTTVGAVQATLAAGHHLVIATGRSLVGVAPVAKRLGLRRGHVICSNGAVTARISGRRLIIEDVVRFDAGPALRRAGDLWAVHTTRAVVHAPGVGRLARELRWFDVTITPGSTTEPGDWLDLTASDLSKASALEAVRRRVRVAPEHTIAVGDGHNDRPMFQWAARAVAMGNAPAEVRAAAGEVCGNITEHGVVEVLRSIAGVR